jgi:hypothetical protein
MSFASPTFDGIDLAGNVEGEILDIGPKAFSLASRKLF